MVPPQRQIRHCISSIAGRWGTNLQRNEGGRKVNPNMDGFGYGEAEELVQTRQEVRLWNEICVI